MALKKPLKDKRDRKKPEKVVTQVKPSDYWDVMQEEAEEESVRGHYSPAAQQQRSNELADSLAQNPAAYEMQP